MEFSKTNNMQVSQNKPIVPFAANEPTTLERIGGVVCKICKQAYKSKKLIDEHFSSSHKSQEVIYTCIVCSKEFVKYKMFHDHCYRHSLGTRVRCKICQKKFFSHQALQLHIQIHNETGEKNDISHLGRTYDCKRCAKTFTKFSDLANHLRHCGQNFPCSICNKSFLQKSYMIRHALSHTEERDFKCTVCLDRFKSKRALVMHNKLQHENNNKYKCGLCDKTFITSTKLKYHINTHDGQRPFPCEHCNATFTNNPNRIKHVKRLHSGQCCHPNLTLIEQINNDSNTSLSELENIEVHGSIIENDGMQEFACSQCPMRFTCRGSWLRHVKRTHLKFKYRCGDCSKIVVYPDPIQSYNTIPLLDSVKPFICYHCGVGFTDKSNLERHIIRAAHLELKYECTQCSKKFFSPLQLSTHEKFHTKDANKKSVVSIVSFCTKKQKNVAKLFKCQCCEKSFGHHWSRLRHMLKEHGKRYVPPANRLKNKDTKKSKPRKNNSHDNIQMDVDVPMVNLEGQYYDSNINLVDKEINFAMPEQYLNVNGMKDLNNFCYDLPKAIDSVNTPLYSNTGKMLDTTIPDTMDSLDNSIEIPNLVNFVNENSEMDEIDNDLLSYFDSYIHGQVDVDILKDTIDIPGCPEESVNLDSISPDFNLATFPNIAPSKNVHVATNEADNFDLTASRNSFSNNVAQPTTTQFNAGSNLVIESPSFDQHLDSVRSEDQMKSLYNIKIVKTNNNMGSQKKLLLQINPLIEPKKIIFNKTTNALTYNQLDGVDTNQNFHHSLIQNNTKDEVYLTNPCIAKINEKDKNINENNLTIYAAKSGDVNHQSASVEKSYNYIPKLGEKIVSTGLIVKYVNGSYILSN